MLRTKQDVDRHVAAMFSKLKTPKEKNFRAYSIARLYYDIGEYDTCIQYVLKYLSAKDDNPAAHNLLGQAYTKVGKKHDALTEFKMSFNLDSNQSNLLCKVCELLSDESIDADAGCIRYWIDRANITFPRHPALFKLRQRLVQMEHSDSAVVTSLLKEQVAACPNDPSSHARLLRHLVQCNRASEAFHHALNIQLDNSFEFCDSLSWQESIIEAIDSYKDEVYNESSTTIWKYWFLYLTTLEKKINLQLNWKYSPLEVTNTLKSFDETLFNVANCNKIDNCKDLLQHFGGQFCLFGGELLLKKAVHDQLGWREVVKLAAPFFLLAMQIESSNPHNNITSNWNSTSAYRKSQAGHTLLAFAKNKEQYFLDSITSYCTGQQWKERLYRELLSCKDSSLKLVPSYFLSSFYIEPNLKLPSLINLYEADFNARSYLPQCLHHQIWIGMNIDRLSKIVSNELPLFVDNLPNCGPETLSDLDLDAFLYCNVFIAQQKVKTNRKKDLFHPDRPATIPSVLMEPLCTPEQTKWWKFAKDLSKINNYQTDDRRAVLTRGIETIRCVANHGIDPHILTLLGRIFAQRADNEYKRKQALVKRAMLYYSAAVPLLERLKNQVTLEPPKKRLFNYNNQNVSEDYVNSFLEECKLFIGKCYMEDDDDDRAIETLTDIKSPYASFYLFKIYMKLADMHNNLEYEETRPDINGKHFSLLCKARYYIYVTSDRLKDSNADSNHPLSKLLNEQIEHVETLLSSENCDKNALKDMSKADVSIEKSLNEYDRDANLTPSKCKENSISFNTPRSLEAQVRQLQRKEALFGTVLQQISTLLESNRTLTEQVKEFSLSLEEIKQNSMSSADKRKFLNSVDDVKCRVEELKDGNTSNINDLKKEILDLRKEFEKIKISSNTQQKSDEELYVMEDNYRTNANVPFFQRMPNNATGLPPHPYSVYPPNIYSLYSGQYPAIPPIFPANIFPTDPSLYSDLLASQVAPSHIIPPVQTHIPPPPIVPQTLPIQITPNQLPPQNLPIKTTNIQPPLQNVSSFQSASSSSSLRTVKSLTGNIISQITPQVTEGQAIPQAVHDYQIPLPSYTNSKSQYVFSLQTSTPKSNQESVSDKKPFSLFDGPKINSSTEPTKPLSVFGSSTLNVQNEQKSINDSTIRTRSLSEKSHDSFDPCPDYQPMIPLPDEVVPTTGEENETILFSDKAKLYRFISGEWKERGCGQVKILKNKDTEKIRLLMRRDVVHTICANHIITPEMELSQMKGTDKVYFWVANDFADETVKLEKFCIKFKVLDIAKNFYNVFNSCKDLYKSVKQTEKPTSGEENSSQKKDSKNDHMWNQPVTVGGITFTKTPTFKEISNSPIIETTTSNENSKPNPFASFTFAKPNINLSTSTIPSVTKNDQIAISKGFNLDTSNVTIAKVEDKNLSIDSTTSSISLNITDEKIPSEVIVETNTVGWGDKFKPKPGSWNCTACYVNNDSQSMYCVSCDNPKEPGMVRKEKKIEFQPTKFTFGFNNVSNQDLPQSTFTFGINEKEQSEKVPTVFGTSFTFNKNFETQKDLESKPDNKEKTCVFGSSNNEKYDFVFKPRNVSVGKSPNKSLGEEVENDESEHFQEDEGHNIFFEPVIPLPDKVEVKTGEENEIILYSHRAKLFRFSENEWKECGVGDIKILQNSENKKFRVVMRREPVLKICLNHALTSEVSYSMKDEKTWMFVVNDFSTGEVCLQQFCIRFANKDVATEFKEAIDDVKNKLQDASSYQDISKNKKKDEKPCTIEKVVEDVQFISESIVSDEEIQNARKLMLPDKFYAYKQLPKCSGCRGCSSEDDTFKRVKSTENEINKPPMNFNFSNIFNNSAQITPESSEKDSVKTEKGTMFSSLKFSVPVTKSIFGGSAVQTTTTTTPVFGSESFQLSNSQPVFGSSNQGFNFNFLSTTKNVDNTAATNNKSKTTENIFNIFTESKPTFSGPNIFSNVNQSNTLSGFNFSLKKDAVTVNTSNEDNSAITPTEGDDIQEECEKSLEKEEKEIFFKPVIPLPDEVEVKTGEEDEDVLYSHRAKLFRFVDSEWKECGVGDVKILKHQVSKKIRVLMRREPIMKVCLNHILTPEITYVVKDEKSWLFHACDFSTGEFSPQQFCLRFIDKNVASDFKENINKILLSYVADSQNDSEKKDEIPNETETKPVIANKQPETLIFGGLEMSKLSIPKSTNVNEEVKGGFVKNDKEQNNRNTDGSELTNDKDKTQTPFGASDLFKSMVNPSKSLGPNFLNATGNIENTGTTKTPGFANFETSGENYFAIAAENLKIKTDTTKEEISSDKAPFTWAGAGTPLFTSAINQKSKTDSSEDREHDPHFEPIIPLPQEITVVTGEEDEIIEFNEKAKLFRYSNNEWKERGIGEMKILHHPSNKTYRMLLRQNQVHKVVLNQLITSELNLLPMSSDTKAFMWFGLNYTDDEKGVMEKLAIRFHNENLALSFKSKIETILKELSSTSLVSQNTTENHIDNTTKNG